MVVRTSALVLAAIRSSALWSTQAKAQHGLIPKSLSAIPVRHRSWTNPLSKFRRHAPTNDTNQTAYTEESIEDTKDRIQSLRYLIRTTDMAPKLKSRLMASKLVEMVSEKSRLSEDEMKVADGAVMELYRISGKNMTASTLSTANLIQLFELSAKSLVAQSDTNKPVKIPRYISIISQFLLHDHILATLPASTIVYLVELGTLSSPFKLVVSSLVAQKARFLSGDFVAELLDYYQHQGKLSLAVFEELATSIGELHPKGHIEESYNDDTSTSTQVGHHVPMAGPLISDEFYIRFNNYIESLFIDSVPRTHEYQDLERNVDRIQWATNTVIESAHPENLSVRASVILLQLGHQLANVANCARLDQNCNQLLAHLDQMGHEALAEALAAASTECLDTLVVASVGHQRLHNIVCDHILAMPPSPTQVQVQLMREFGQAEDDEHVYDTIQRVAVGDDWNEIYTRIIQTLMMRGMAPRGKLINRITKRFESHSGFSESVLSYKFRIDRAIALNDHVMAVEIFEDSLDAGVEWSIEPEPRVSATLNNLIVCVCSNMEDIEAIFAVFTKIKRSMGGPDHQCNAEAITALAQRMLQAEYVGDLIEMLKRELPAIDKEATTKLPLHHPWGTQYRRLFDKLANFVITYTNESTYETNWVLYGELHKYFVVPYETYLPTMKFFCSKDRLNAALIIFRQVRKLHELHGSHGNLPPSRDMYLHLFEQFGNKLYEEGVIELHENLKMDVNISHQDIHLQNAILNAYSNLQDVARARELFLAMSTTPKQLGGINEDSVQIMIKTYTYNDLAYVQKFWNNLSQFNIIPNRAIYRQYLIAYVYHGLADEALGLIDGMQDYDIAVDSDLIVSLHNFCMDKAGQAKISAWAQENYPALWDDAVNTGLLVGATNYAPSTNLIAADK